MTEEKNKYKQIANDAKEYLRMQYDLLRLEMLEKLSLIISLVLVIIICVILFLAAFIYFSFALVFWLKDFFGGSMIPAFLIVGGVFLILVFIFLAVKDKMFVNPLIKQISSILFKEGDEK